MLGPFIAATLPRGQASAGRAALLDVGCGRLGLAGFLPRVNVVGVDVAQAVDSAANFTFRAGDVMNLEFPAASFPFVSCIDVLEHLPVQNRSRAVDELVRVAAQAVLIACPHGATAAKCDAEFREALRARGRVVPSWLDEHLAHPYPSKDEIVAALEGAARRAGRDVEITVAYSEPATVSTMLRASAAVSSYLYAAFNIAMGMMLPALSSPGASDSYRLLVLARFKDDRSQQAFLPS